MSQNADPPSEAIAHELLEVLSPGSIPVTIEPLPGSYSNYTHLVEAVTPDGVELRLITRCYAVFGSYDRGEKASREFKIIQFLFGSEIPVPEPLLLDEKGEILGIPGIVTAFVSGRQVEEPADPIAWAQALARMLVRIHSVPCDSAAHGFLLDANVEASWFIRGDSVPDYMTAHPDGYAVWQVVRHMWPNLEPVKPTLVHIDYWPGNILWENGQISAVLDWEEAALGDPGIDVAYARMEMILTGQAQAAEEFLSTYEREAGHPVANLGFWELAAAARPMFNPEGRISQSPARENFRYFVAQAQARTGI